MQKSETQKNINDNLVLNRREERQIFSSNLHTGDEFAQQGIFAGTVNYWVSTCGFMIEIL